jgi:hypothetical protein
LSLDREAEHCHHHSGADSERLHGEPLSIS